jgi:hypothetical protein
MATNKSLINLEPVREQVRAKLLEKYDSTIYMNTSSIDIKVDVKEILEQFIEEKHLEEPKVYITTEAYVKLRKLVDDTTTEIGWYGTVTKMPGLESVFVIDDIIVYPQVVTGATCVQDDDRVFEFELSLSTDQVNRKRFHGHSHVNMGVTPSGVDEQFYQDILTQVDDYFIIMITNKSGNYYTRFYDMHNNILYTSIPVQVMLDDGIALEHWYDDATQNNLKEHTYSAPVKAGADKKNFQGSIFDSPYDDYDYDPYESYADRYARYYESTKQEKRKPGRPKKGSRWYD